MRRRLLVLAACLAAVGLVAYVALQRAGRATVPKVVDRALLPADRPPPAPDPARPGTLAAAVDGVPFPDLARFGWQARAAREDRVGGRRTMTLVYDRRGRRMTYTIVAGTDNLDDTHPIRVSYDRSGTELNVSLGYSTRWVARFARRNRPVVVTHPVGNDGGGDPSGIRRVLSWSTSLDAR